MAVFLASDAAGQFDNIDAGDIDCIADLLAAFKADGYVMVDILRSRRGAHGGERYVTGRKPALISIHRYVSIENATVRLIEEAD